LKTNAGDAGPGRLWLRFYSLETPVGVARDVAQKAFPTSETLRNLAKHLILLVGGDGLEPPTLSV
jgi:hypothetical protein